VEGVGVGVEHYVPLRAMRSLQRLDNESLITRSAGSVSLPRVRPAHLHNGAAVVPAFARSPSAGVMPVHIPVQILSDGFPHGFIRKKSSFINSYGKEKLF